MWWADINLWEVNFEGKRSIKSKIIQENGEDKIQNLDVFLICLQTFGLDN